MKNKFYTYLQRTLLLMLVILIPLIMLLMYEERFFWEQARLLTQMREEYATYELGLKRMIAERRRLHAEEAVSHLAGDVKKKMVSAGNLLTFTPVNRDATYVRASAISFVRKHGVEERWRAHYDDVVYAEPAQRRHAARRSRTTRHRQFVALDHDTRMLAESHRFIPPIAPGLYWISSPYGPRRLSNGSWSFHYGIDMAAPYGTLVKAADGGVVIEAGWADGFGKRVVISHGAHCKTRYAHLSSIKVQVGDSVLQGQTIGKVGNSGHTRGKNGVHLHWEVIGCGGKRFNPKIFLERTRNS